MHRNLIGKHIDELELYFLAGVATTPLFMERFRLALLNQLFHPGLSIHSELLFPYGDRSRGLLAQLWEIRADIMLSVRKIKHSIGGTRTWSAIDSRRASTSQRRITLLIGHSGGGIAAVHAAEVLRELRDHSKCYVVMIGSPKCRIPDWLRSSVLAIHAMGLRRKRGFRGEARVLDPVTRLGIHGGWRIRNRFPSWEKGKYAPASMIAIPIIGSHADYFRDSVPYVDENGRSNLDLTVDAILTWLKGLNDRYHS